MLAVSGSVPDEPVQDRPAPERGGPSAGPRPPLVRQWRELRQHWRPVPGASPESSHRPAHLRRPSAGARLGVADWADTAEVCHAAVRVVGGARGFRRRRPIGCTGPSSFPTQSVPGRVHSVESDADRTSRAVTVTAGERVLLTPDPAARMTGSAASIRLLQPRRRVTGYLQDPCARPPASARCAVRAVLPGATRCGTCPRTYSTGAATTPEPRLVRRTVTVRREPPRTGAAPHLLLGFAPSAHHLGRPSDPQRRRRALRGRSPRGAAR